MMRKATPMTIKPPRVKPDAGDNALTNHDRKTDEKRQQQDERDGIECLTAATALVVGPFRQFPPGIIKNFYHR